MAKVIVHNDTECSLHYGPVTIPPGMARAVDEAYLPTAGPSADAAPAAPTPTAEELEAQWISEILARPIKDIAERLPGFGDQIIAKLEAAEEAKGEDARKGLLELLAKTKLERATHVTA